MARQPRIGSSRLQEGGQLATHKQDFNAHVEGGGFRHTADHVDMNPSLTQFSSPNVQGTLELIAGFASTAGSGFVSVGNQTADGYAAGSYNVTDSSDFRATLLSAFTDTRLQNGGIVLVLAGTYQLDNTVTVPGGITIMGEPAGTIISGNMSEAPMFLFETGTTLSTIGGDSGGGSVALEVGAPLDGSGLRDLILVDNLDGYVKSGSIAIPSMVTAPMVQMETGARLYCDNVKFIGRLADGPVLNRDKTLRAIGVTTGGSDSTHLTVNRCFFDGLQTGILFDPSAGNIDHLTITNCRARIFGDESGSINFATNYFAGMSLCNFLADNNYVIAASTGQDVVYSCFVVTTAGGGSSDVSVVISNTYGKPSSLEEVVSVYGEATLSPTLNLKASIINNNWGGSLDSEWFVTVGPGGATGGDYQGAGALDLLFQTSFDVPANVYIYPGTYTVTNPGNDRYNLIGILTETGNRPLVNLNMTGAATDEVGNSVLYCGRDLKNLKFVTTNASFQSVRPGGNNPIKEVTVKNCIFEDAGLSVSDLSSTTLPDLVEVDNCRFRQTNTFANDISAMLPAVDSVVLKNSHFSGYGYFGLIGNDVSLGYSSTDTNSNILIENCRFDQSSSTITGASPLTIESFLVINATSHEVTIRNNTFIVSGSFGVAAIANATRTGADFENYVYVEAKSVFVENNFLNLANTTFDVGGTNYMLPGLKIVPEYSARLTNNKFLNCMCQIGGAASALSGSIGTVIVDGCDFRVDGATYAGWTMLDMDLDPSLGVIANRKVIVQNCNFDFTQQINSPNRAYHALLGAYSAASHVQIYTDDLPIFFQNNNLNGILGTGGYTENSGVFIQNIIVGGLSTEIIPTVVQNNSLFVRNNFSFADAAYSASAMRISGTDIRVQDNGIRFSNEIAVGLSAATCLLVTALDTDSGSFAPNKSMVSGNAFSRKDVNNAAASISGYIHTNGSSQAGIITNNSFSEDTIDGSDQSLIVDSAGWSSYNNINEVYTIVTRGELGVMGLHDNTATNEVYTLVGGAGLGAGLSSAISIDPFSGTTPVVFGYQDTTDDVNFKWFIPLHGVVPWGATITEVEVTVDLSVAATTSATTNLRLYTNGGVSDTDVNNSLTTAGHTHTLSVSRRIISGSFDYIALEAEITSGSATNYTVTPLTIKYKL